MRRPSRRMVIAATGLAVAAAAAGGAVAATQSDNPAAERQAFLNDAAARLGVTSDKLESALKGAAIDRIDAALKAGKLTQAEAQALKDAINSGKVPLGPGLGFGPGHGGLRLHAVGDVFDAAASYLGLTQAQLRTQLMSGKSLADIAKAQNKSLDGLKTAITNEVQSKLDQAVKDGRLTQAQADTALSEFKEHLDDIVTRSLPTHIGGAGFGFRPSGRPDFFMPHRTFRSFAFGPHRFGATFSAAGPTA